MTRFLLLLVIGFVLVFWACAQAPALQREDSHPDSTFDAVRETAARIAMDHVRQGVQQKLTSVLETKPGVRVMLANSGLNKIIEDALPEIVNNLKSTPFPDQSITTSVSLVGEVTLNITNIHISELEIKNVVATFIAPNSVSVSATGVSVVITLDFSFKQKGWPHTAGTGDIVASSNPSQIELIVAIGVRKDDPSKPQFLVSKSAVSLGTMNIKIHGGGSVGWLLNALEGLFKNQIRKSLETNIQDNLALTINVQVNDLIAQNPVVFPIPFPPETGMEGQIDVGLTSPPVVVGGNDPEFVVDSKVYFSIPNRPANPPFPQIDLPGTPTSPSDDFSVYVSQWVANNAVWQLFNDGKLQYRLTNDIIPPESPIHLNTKDLMPFIPELFQACPNCDVVIDLIASSSPMVQFNTPVSVALNGTLVFSVVNATKEIDHAFTVSIVASGSMGKLSVKPSAGGNAIVINGELNPLELSLTLTKSSIGNVNVDRIRTTVTILVNNGILPTVNEKLAAGIQIDLPEGLQVFNIVFEFKNGYLAFGGQVKYAPACGTSLYYAKRVAFMTKKEKMLFGSYGCINGYFERKLCRDLMCTK